MRANIQFETCDSFAEPEGGLAAAREIHSFDAAPAASSAPKQQQQRDEEDKVSKL